MSRKIVSFEHEILSFFGRTVLCQEYTDSEGEVYVECFSDERHSIYCSPKFENSKPLDQMELHNIAMLLSLQIVGELNRPLYEKFRQKILTYISRFGFHRAYKRREWLAERHCPKGVIFKIVEHDSTPLERVK